MNAWVAIKNAEELASLNAIKKAKELASLNAIKKAKELASPTITYQDIEMFTTRDEGSDEGSDDDNEMTSVLQCHTCENNAICTKIQNDMLAAVKNRFDPKHERLQQPISNKFKKCGREGTVFLFENTAIKVITFNQIGHDQRVENWEAAMKAEVGPSIKNTWFTKFKFDIDKTRGEIPEEAWTGWSCVQSTSLNSIQEINMQKIVRLIEKTANAGLLHMDPSIDNMMEHKINETIEYRFIDWEEAAMFDPRKKNGVCLFCQISKAIMLALLKVSISTSNDFTSTQRQELHAILVTLRKQVNGDDIVNFFAAIPRLEEQENFYFRSIDVLEAKEELTQKEREELTQKKNELGARIIDNHHTQRRSRRWVEKS